MPTTDPRAVGTRPSGIGQNHFPTPDRLPPTDSPARQRRASIRNHPTPRSCKFPCAPAQGLNPPPCTTPPPTGFPCAPAQGLNPPPCTTPPPTGFPCAPAQGLNPPPCTTPPPTGFPCAPAQGLNPPPPHTPPLQIPLRASAGLIAQPPLTFQSPSNTPTPIPPGFSPGAVPQPQATFPHPQGAAAAREPSKCSTFV